MSTIAEKLQLIVENQQNVYDAGYAAGQQAGGEAEGTNFARYATAYEFKNANLFGTSKVTFDLDNVTSLSYFYRMGNSSEYVENTTVEHMVINCPNLITSCTQVFHINDTRGDNTLKRITFNVNTSGASMHNFSAFMKALEVFDGTPLDLSATSNPGLMFSGATKLQEVRFAPNTIIGNLNLSPQAALSGESVQSVINGLVDLTGGDTKTLTLHRNIALTDDQKSAITAKNWTLVQ